MKEKLEAKLKRALEFKANNENTIEKLKTALELLEREPGIEAIINANFDMGTDRY